MASPFSANTTPVGTGAARAAYQPVAPAARSTTAATRRRGRRLIDIVFTLCSASAPKVRPRPDGRQYGLRSHSMAGRDGGRFALSQYREFRGDVEALEALQQAKPVCLRATRQVERV